jgi:hypothetical protein
MGSSYVVAKDSIFLKKKLVYDVFNFHTEISWL